MDEIIKRLDSERKIERAKSIMEAAGYKIVDSKDTSSSKSPKYTGVRKRNKRENSRTIKESQATFNNDDLVPSYAVINEKGQYAGAPCFSYEEARELAAQDETRHIFKIELEE